MSSAILGTKLGMTQIFDEAGNRVPVTVIEAKPNIVVQKRTLEKHNYSAIQVGFDEVPARKLSKPRQGIFTKLKIANLRNLREIRMSPDEVEAYNVGDTITVEALKDLKLVDVTGISKGKGFQGVVKLFGFKGNTQTRGSHEYRRHPGSIGMCQKPGRVIKGTKLPRHLGNIRVTTQNLKLIKVDPERNLLLIRGAVPGTVGRVVMVQKAKKK